MSSTSHGPSQQVANEPSHSGSRPSVDPRPTSKDRKPVEESVVGNRKEKKKARENKSLARPEIPKVESIRDVRDRRDKVYTQEEKAKAWSDAAGMVQTYSDDMIKRWKEEIDTYLVFAGLFSAVLTTFNVQTYVLLSPNSPDPSVAILQQISSQLASFSIHPPFVNSTQQPTLGILANSIQSSPIPRWAIWLNGLWFSGLILSLSAATIGIMAKQWTNEYLSGVAGNSRPAARVRQHRLNNLKKWHVEDIVGIIPVLLQLALALFLAGLLLLLWNLHNAVAAISSVIVGLLGVFVVMTTLLPLFHTSCSYLTPQARAIYLWEPKYWVHCFHSGRRRAIKYIVTLFTNYTRALSSTIEALSQFRTSTFSLLQLVGRTLVHVAFPPDDWRERKQTWRGREQESIGDLTTELDTRILVEAYSVTLHPDALSAATVCLIDCSTTTVVDYFRQLHKSAQEHFGPVADSQYGPLGRGNQQQLLWSQISLCALVWGDVSVLSKPEKTALETYFEYGCWSSSMKAADTEWALSAMDAIIDYIGPKDTSPPLLNETLIARQRERLLYHPDISDDNMARAFLHDLRWKYRKFRLAEEGAPVEDEKAALTIYLKRIETYLRCADKAMEAPLPDGDLETVRAYTRDALSQLARTLQERFNGEQVPHIPTAVDAEALRDVMFTLAFLVSNKVLQCIDGELVSDVFHMAETLAQSYDYGDYYHGIEISLSAGTLTENVIRLKGGPGAERGAAVALLQAAIRTYHKVQLAVDRPVTDNAKAALSTHLQCIARFLPYANATLNAPLPSHDLDTVRVYTRNILAHLTRTLLNPFTADQVQHIRTTVDAKAVWRVMSTLSRLPSDDVLRCIDGDLFPDVLRMTDILAKRYDYDDFFGASIPEVARKLKGRVIRLKPSDPGEKALLQKPSATVQDAGATVSLSGPPPPQESPLQSPSSAVAPSATSANAAPTEDAVPPGHGSL